MLSLIRFSSVVFVGGIVLFIFIYLLKYQILKAFLCFNHQERIISPFPRCKLCSRELNLSNMGTAALKSHMKYQKYTELVKIKNGSSDFFKKASSDRHIKKMKILKLIQIYHHFLLKKI